MKTVAITLVKDRKDVAAHLRHVLPDIRIVDAGSRKPIPNAWLTFLDSGTFTASWNSAIRAAVAVGADFCWLINGDVDGLNRRMMRELTDNAVKYNAEIASPAINNLSSVDSRSVMPHMFPGKGVEEVQWVDSSAPLINTTWFLDNAGFDEHLPLTGAMMDLCFRTRGDVKIVVKDLEIAEHFYLESPMQTSVLHTHLLAKHGSEIEAFYPFLKPRELVK